MMRVAVVGALGQLGAAVAEECARRYDVVAFDRASLDVTDGAAVSRVLTTAKPDAIVNCTGYNAVDGAQDHPVDALQVNAFAVRSLARVANVLGSTLVHYSSDFVFDGFTQSPLTEEHPANPRSVYATSKLLGEWFAFDVSRHYVLRVESLFGGVPDGPPAKGTVATIINALREGRVAKVFSDRTVSPTFAIDAARATCDLIDRQAEPGLYHCVNSGHCTWQEFAEEAARVLGVEPKLEVLRFADVRLPAERPQYCALSNHKLTSLGIVMPTWQEALRKHVRSLVVSR
jgi:dTDP-4-dehydrorhamnose reductase